MLNRLDAVETVFLLHLSSLYLIPNTLYLLLFIFLETINATKIVRAFWLKW